MVFGKNYFIGMSEGNRSALALSSPFHTYEIPLLLKERPTISPELRGRGEFSSRETPFTIAPSPFYTGNIKARVLWVIPAVRINRGMCHFSRGFIVGHFRGRIPFSLYTNIWRGGGGDPLPTPFLPPSLFVRRQICGRASPEHVSPIAPCG